MITTILVAACLVALFSERADRGQSARMRAASEATGHEKDGRRPSLAVRSFGARSVVSLTAPRPAGLYRGDSAATWAARYRTMWRRYTNAKRVLMTSESVTEAINLACATYGFCSTLWRKARCESGYSADPPHNNDARGLFQFIPSTFASTPYRSFSIFSPYANALAAGWMHQQGRGGEWTCA